MRTVKITFVFCCILLLPNCIFAQEDICKHYYDTGVIELANGKPKKAIGWFEQAIEADSAYSLGYYGVGFCKSQLGLHKEALKYFNISISLNDQFDKAYLNRGSAYYKMKFFQNALQDFQTAIEINPKNADGYYNSGMALYDLERYKESVEFLTKSIKINSTDSEAFYWRGRAKFNVGDSPGSINDLTRFIGMSQEDLSNAYASRAIVYTDLGQYAEAMKDISEVKSNNAKTAEFLIWSYFAKESTGDVKGAGSDLKKALKLDDEVSEMFLQRAVTLATLKKFKAAKNNVDRYFKLKPDDARALHLLGKIHFALKEVDKACDCWKRASTTYEDSKELVEEHCK